MNAKENAPCFLIAPRGRSSAKVNGRNTCRKKKGNSIFFRCPKQIRNDTDIAAELGGPEDHG